jgi:cyanate permease
VHEAAGSWTAPLLVVLASILVLAVAGMLASGDRRAAPAPG